MTKENPKIILDKRLQALQKKLESEKAAEAEFKSKFASIDLRYNLASPNEMDDLDLQRRKLEDDQAFQAVKVRRILRVIDEVKLQIVKARGQEEDERKRSLIPKNLPVCLNCGSNEHVELRKEIQQPIFAQGCDWTTVPVSPYAWRFEYVCKGPDVRCLKVIAVFPELNQAKITRRKRLPNEIVVEGSTLSDIDRASEVGGRKH
jgi:hypothetical protein